MSRWSKLKRDVENLMSPKMEFQIYANSYNIGDCVPLPRFWVTIKKQIIWDWPKDFIETEGWYFYKAAKEISQLLRDYINTPDSELLTKEFDDPFRLVPILRICDRRIGKRRRENLLQDLQNFEVACIIKNSIFQ